MFFERIDENATHKQNSDAGSAASHKAARLAQRLDSARRAFTTRRVNLSDAAGLKRTGRPMAGDLVLARVERIGQHARLESPEGRRQALYAGDEIIVAYGNRYAPDQFEATVPDTLDMCDLVAGGGVAAQVHAKHSRMRNATRILPIGLLTDAAGAVLNLNRYAMQPAEPAVAACPVMVIVGTSMNAGKTTTAATLIHGLKRAGLNVGAAKITGTGSGGDIWSMVDAGAAPAMDFTDMGYATTADVPVADLEKTGSALISHVSAGNDIAIIEIADGLFQTETSGLLQSAVLRDMIDGVILAAGDAMGAAYGVQWLKDQGLPLKFIAGCVSSSPLGLREAAAATGLPVATLAELANPVNAPRLCLAQKAAPELATVA